MKSLKPVVSDVAMLRAGQYPRIGDQLDAVMKLAAHLRGQGMALPSEVEAWIDRCEDVKRRFPKPAEGLKSS